MAWMVVGVNDDGRTEIMLTGLAGDEAHRLAGKMRDRSTEQQIAAGWNFVARAEPRKQASKAEKNAKSRWHWLNRPMPQQAPGANRPPAITGGVQANQSQAAGSMHRTLRHQGGTTRSGSPASQAAWTMPRLPK